MKKPAAITIISNTIAQKKDGISIHPPMAINRKIMIPIKLFFGPFNKIMKNEILDINRRIVYASVGQSKIYTERGMTVGYRHPSCV